MSSFSSFSQSNFNRGFNAGYKKGYCQNKGLGCIPPISPIAPLTKIGEDLNSYQDGYNNGFEMGLSAQLGDVNDRQRYKTTVAKSVDYIQKQNVNDLYALSKVLKESKGKAFELQKAGDYQSCINIAEAGLKVSPYDYEFMMLCAMSYLELENYSTGLSYLKQAVENDKNSNNIIVEKKIIEEIENGSYQKKREEEKKEIPNKQIETKGSNLITEINQSLATKNYPRALELSNTLISLENGWKSYAIRGYVNFTLGNYSKSVEDYTKSINMNPVSNSYFFRALSKEKLEDYYGSINDYDKIIVSGIAPDNSNMATIYNNKAYSLVILKKYSEALLLVNKAISLSTNEWYIWDTRGEINFQLGHYKNSIEDMTKAIFIKPDQNSYYFRGLSKIKMSDKISGCEDLSKSGELGNAKAYLEIKKNCQ